MVSSTPRYKRVIVKLSGEALRHQGKDFIDLAALDFIAGNVKEISQLGVEVGLVAGGGNIMRGVLAAELGLERTAADQMGMLATVINGLALREALQKAGLPARLFSSIEVGPLAEPYLPGRARESLRNGEVPIFAGGTGNPFVSTDTAALLRACDLGAEIVLKATSVDGIYSADPLKDPAARKFDELSYDEALKRGLKIMDFAAIGLAKENRIPVLVFDFWKERSLKGIILGEKVGTLLRA